MRLEGKITEIGLVNFDAIRLDEICTEMGPEVIVSNQVQVCGSTKPFPNLSLTHQFLVAISSRSLTPGLWMGCVMSARSTGLSC